MNIYKRSIYLGQHCVYPPDRLLLLPRHSTDIQTVCRINRWEEDRWKNAATKRKEMEMLHNTDHPVFFRLIQCHADNGAHRLLKPHRTDSFLVENDFTLSAFTQPLPLKHVDLEGFGKPAVGRHDTECRFFGLRLPRPLDIRFYVGRSRTVLRRKIGIRHIPDLRDRSQLLQ